jgi:hypothetical protein
MIVYDTENRGKVEITAVLYPTHLDPVAAILTEEFLCFPQSLQADAGIVFQIMA